MTNHTANRCRESAPTSGSAFRVCQTCKKDFRPKKKTSRYCCKECQYASGRYNRGGASHRCDNCGIVFKESRLAARFCGIDCANAAQRTAPRRESECKHCGKTFSAKQDHGKWPTYCGLACMRESQHLSIETECGVCGKKFRAGYKSDRDGYRKYCSRECSDISKRTGDHVECVICGKKFWQLRGRLDRNRNNYCSPKCREHKIEDLCGDAWHGGIVNHAGGYIMLATDRVERRSATHKTRLRYRAAHRLAVEQIIGRKLARDEMVWHLNRDLADNRPENLYVFRSGGEMWRAIGRRDYPTQSNIDELKAEAAVFQ